MATRHDKQAGKDEDAHPSQDITGRHPTDALLRRHGHSIHSRPTGKPAVWRDADGNLVPEHVALRSLARRIPGLVDDANYLEALRREGYA